MLYTAETHVPLGSTATLSIGALWHNNFAKGSLEVGDQNETTPLACPTHKVAFQGFWVRIESLPKFVLYCPTIFPTETSNQLR